MRCPSELLIAPIYSWGINRPHAYTELYMSQGYMHAHWFPGWDHLLWKSGSPALQSENGADSQREAVVWLFPLLQQPAHGTGFHITLSLCFYNKITESLCKSKETYEVEALIWLMSSSSSRLPKLWCQYPGNVTTRRSRKGGSSLLEDHVCEQGSKSPGKVKLAFHNNLSLLSRKLNHSCQLGLVSVNWH